jgi:hypothetical protein
VHRHPAELELMELEGSQTVRPRRYVAASRRGVGGQDQPGEAGPAMTREDVIGMVLLLLAVIVACTLLEMLIRP